MEVFPIGGHKKLFDNLPTKKKKNQLTVSSKEENQSINYIVFLTNGPIIIDRNNSVADKRWKSSRTQWSNNGWFV